MRTVSRAQSGTIPLVSIQRFTDALRKAADGENYYAALALALTLPDVCGKIATPTAPSAARYVAWIRRYLPADYWRLGEGAFLPGGRPWPRITPEDFYALRCAYLHEGTDDITEQRIRQALDRFKFLVPPRGHSVHRQFNVIKETGKVELLLGVAEFCDEIRTGVDAWSRDISTDTATQARHLFQLQIYFGDRGVFKV